MIDRSTLTPLVQNALNSDTAKVIDWDVEQLHGGFGKVTAIYCFTGQARERDRDQEKI